MRENQKNTIKKSEYLSKYVFREQGVHVLASMHNWTNLTSSPSHSLFSKTPHGVHSFIRSNKFRPNLNFITHDLLDLYRIFENLLHYRSNDLDYPVVPLIPISLWDTIEHPNSIPS